MAPFLSCTVIVYGSPGTITVHVRDDLFLVHCLDREMGQGLENSEFEQKVLKMEGSSDER